MERITYDRKAPHPNRKGLANRPVADLAADVQVQPKLLGLRDYGASKTWRN
jgi:hypothetical protein